MVIDVIKQHCMEEKLQHDMREAVKQRADIMWLQNDCIYNAFVSRRWRQTSFKR